MPVSTLEGASQTQWEIPKMTELVKRISDENKVYIYSVNPQMFIRYQGGMGTFVIRGRAEGERYSEPCVIPGISTETNPVDAGKMTLREYDGLMVARDILGTGAFRDPSDDLTKRGVFLSRTNPPSESEIEAAQEIMDSLDADTVADGNRKYEVNGGIDAKTGLSNIGAHHIAAAKRLGVTPPWTRKAVRLEECPACGESVKPGAAMCNHCDAVLDEEKARKYFPHKFSGEAKRGQGRPPKEASE